MTAAERPELLVDTSVAVALCVADHEYRAICVAAVRGYRLGLAGHAAFESYSVLTRLPAPSRRTPAAASRLLLANFPATRFLGGEATRRLLNSLPALDLTGGGVYDALVAAVALEHQLRLVTRDRRAVPTYRAVGVDLQLVG